MHSKTITARAARWSAAHWKTATFAWLAFVAVAIALGTAVGKIGLTSAQQADGESARAERILADAKFEPPAGENVLVAAATGAGLRREAARVADRLRRLPQVARVHRAPQVSNDGRALLLSFDLKGDPETADARVQPVLDAVAALQRQAPAFTIVELGDASANHELNDTVDQDLHRAERLSLPVTFAILLLAFGAFVAAGVPVLLAFSAVLASLGLEAITSHVVHAADATASVILLIGMAVGVDYSLFYLKREREERRRGHGDDALVRAAATSGHAILVSGATVLIAMAGMLFSGDTTFESIGVGAMLVVATAMIGSLTVLPALLGKLGDRVDRGVIAVLAATLYRIGIRFRFVARARDRRTVLQRVLGARSESRLWSAVLRPVLRRPWLAAGVAVWALALLASPALHLHTKLPGVDDLPKSLAVVQSFDEIQRHFPGAELPAEVVVEGDLSSPQAKRSIDALIRRTHAQSAAIDPSRTVERIDVPLAGTGDDAASQRSLAALRSTILPATLGHVHGLQYAVTGEAAGDHDFTSLMKQRFPIVFLFVLGLAFLLLLVTFRSIIVPLTAIALNLLSVAASYGILVWIFQDGHLQRLLGFHSNGGVVTWLPLFLFAVLFALSMDYHVFIVSRIKELVDGGMRTADAVSTGIRSTAGTVSAAAAVMVAVFAIFATLRTPDIKQMGVGLAAAVLLDATIIRGVLLPATMTLFGRWNWWLPRRSTETAALRPAEVEV
ncbi:MAG TPA: MMPL family transporter [Gaiellaceae bacterium]|nr:MMPL family transporter [Gaiellaceae bacterium]